MCSRLYFGVHYPTDVLAGFALGTAFALFWELVYRKAYGARYFILAALAVLFLLLIPAFPSGSLVLAAGATAGCAVFLPLDHAFIHAPIPRSPRKFFRLLVGGVLLGGLFVFRAHGRGDGGLSGALPPVPHLIFSAFFSRGRENA